MTTISKEAGDVTTVDLPGCFNELTRGLVRSRLAPVLLNAYRHPALRSVVLSSASRLERGRFFSQTLRDVLNCYHGVSVGAYSYGECLVPGAFPAGVTIGRYVSVAAGVRVFLRNHPLTHLSTHPFFYNSRLGYVQEDAIDTGSLEICHDAWLGAGAILTPACTRVGLGAVVGAGSVVTKDVPDFAVVAGNPARVVRYRFSTDIHDAIRASRWWERTIEELSRNITEMTWIVEEAGRVHPLLRQHIA